MNNNIKTFLKLVIFLLMALNYPSIFAQELICPGDEVSPEIKNWAEENFNYMSSQKQTTTSYELRVIAMDAAPESQEEKNDGIAKFMIDPNGRVMCKIEKIKDTEETKYPPQTLSENQSQIRFKDYFHNCYDESDQQYHIENFYTKNDWFYVGSVGVSHADNAINPNSSEHYQGLIREDIGQVDMIAADGNRVFIHTKDNKLYFASISETENMRFARNDVNKDKWTENVRKEYEQDCIDNWQPFPFGYLSIANDVLIVSVEVPFIWYELEAPNFEFDYKDPMNPNKTSHVKDEVIDLAVGEVFKRTYYDRKYNSDFHSDMPPIIRQDAFDAGHGKYADYFDGVVTYYLLVKRTNLETGEISYLVRWVDEQTGMSKNTWDGSGVWRSLDLREDGWAKVGDYRLDTTSTSIDNIGNIYNMGNKIISSKVDPGVLGFTLLPLLFTPILGEYVVGPTLVIGTLSFPLLIHNMKSMSLGVSSVLAFTELSITFGLLSLLPVVGPFFTTCFIYSLIMTAILIFSAPVIDNTSMGAQNNKSKDARFVFMIDPYLPDFNKSNPYEDVPTVFNGGELEPYRPFDLYAWWDVYKLFPDKSHNTDYWWAPYNPAESNINENSRIDATHEHLILSTGNGKIYSISFNFGSTDYTWRTRNLPAGTTASTDEIKITRDMYVVVKGKKEGIDGYYYQSYLKKEEMYGYEKNPYGLPKPKGQEVHFAHENEWNFIEKDQYEYFGTPKFNVSINSKSQINKTNDKIYNNIQFSTIDSIKYYEGSFSAYDEDINNKKIFKALDYTIITNKVKILPLNLLFFRPGMDLVYSINGEPFRECQNLNDVTSLSYNDYADDMSENENEQSSLIYHDNSNALLVSPHFKEGYNTVTFRYKDYTGKPIYRDMQIMQLTVPPFIKPEFPKMNEYVNHKSFTIQVKCEHIMGETTMPADWFVDATYDITIDGNVIQTEINKDITNNIVYFNVNDLNDGNHQIDVNVAYNSLKNSQSWRFWVDTTPPQISFPEKMVFSNKTNDKINLTCEVKDQIPFSLGDISYNVDTILLNNIKMTVENNDNHAIDLLYDKNNTRMGIHSLLWNGRINLTALTQGIHHITTEATDRLGNTSSTSHNLIIDNAPPVIDYAHLNTKIMNSNSGIPELTYQLTLDQWEENGSLNIEVKDASSNQHFSLQSQYNKGQEAIYSLVFYNNNLSVFKDGKYEINIYTEDEISNKSEPIFLDTITIDLTKPVIKNAYVNPFVIKEDHQLTLKFEISEENDEEINKTDQFETVIELFDHLGNTIAEFNSYYTVIPRGTEFEKQLTIPENLKDGKYFIKIKIKDKNQNEAIETAVFIKNAMPPEITLPENNQSIKGITPLYGNVSDPKWDNDYPFTGYSIFYKSGKHELPDNLDSSYLIHDGWLAEGITVPEYQIKENHPVNYGQFIVENNNITGTIDTASISVGTISLLIIASEENGYKIGSIKTYNVEKITPAQNVNVTIENKDLLENESFNFNFTDNIIIKYEVIHQYNNPVDIYSCIKDEKGKIIKQNLFKKLNSNDLNGIPDIQYFDKGIFVYQDENKKYFIHLKNNSDKKSKFMFLIKSESQMINFVDEYNSPIEHMIGLIDDNKQLAMIKELEVNEEFIFGFNIIEDSNFTVSSIIDSDIGNVYIGKNKMLDTTGNAIIRTGSGYPSISWNGKDILDRYVPNGIYTITIEAYGTDGGKGKDTCNITVGTPFVINNVDIINPEIHPGIETLNYSTFIINTNKLSYFDLSIYNQAGIKMKNTAKMLSNENGDAEFIWKADDDQQALVPEGKYYAEILCEPLDGSPVINITKSMFPVLDTIIVKNPVTINPLIKCELLPFENAEQYNGTPLITGDSKYQVMIKPKGQYLPDKEINLTVTGEGTNVVEAYPDMNYMAAIRNNYEELWASYQINKIKFSTHYSDNHWDADKSYYPDYDANQIDNNSFDFKVISYDVKKNEITKHGINTTLQVKGKVSLPGKRWEYIHTPPFNPFVFPFIAVPENDWVYFRNMSLNTVTGTFVVGKSYMSDNSVQIKNKKIIARDSINTDSSSNQNINITIEFDIYCPVNNDTSFNLGDYLAIADGAAFMGPDIPNDSSSVYSHHTPYATKGNEFTPVTLIDNPKESTGMRPEDKTELIWREKSRLIFYYIGEDYENYTGSDTPKTSLENLNFENYNIQNVGGGDNHKNVEPLLIEAPSNIISDMIENETRTFIDGKINFIVKKINNQYLVSIESFAEDRICYPYPALVSSTEFENSHNIGNSQLGIPSTTINGKRQKLYSGSNIQYVPNYYVPLKKNTNPSEQNVYFTDNQFTVDSILTFNEQTGYNSVFNLQVLNNLSQNNLPPNANIKRWYINEINAAGIEFINIPVSIDNNLDNNAEFKITDINIHKINDSSWNLSQDNITNKEELYSKRKNIDIDSLNRYGVLKDQRIKDAYLFSHQENTYPYNLYHTNNEGLYIDNTSVVINPAIRNYSDNDFPSGYEINILGLDNNEYKGLKVKSIGIFGKGLKLSDGYILESDDQSPRQLIGINGDAEGEISLSYSSDNLRWHDIPIYNSHPEKKIITYWDITGLSGSYTLRLISRLNNEYNIHTQKVIIGYLLNTLNDDADITTSDGQAKIIFPKGSTNDNLIVNIDAVDMEDIKDIALLPDIAPIGKVVKLSPEGHQFDDIYPQLQFTYNKTEIDKLGIDPMELIIYHMKESGELVALNTIKQLVKVNFDNYGNVINEEIVWDSTINTDNSAIPDYTYVKVWSVTTHFSYYLVLEGIIKDLPVINQKDLTTGNHILNITGTGIAGEQLELYIGDNKYYLKKNPGISYDNTAIISDDGTFSFDNVELKYEGNNFIFIGYTVNNSKQYSKLIVTLDTTAPEIQISNYYPYLSPNNDGKYDHIEITIFANENCIINAKIIEINNKTEVCNDELHIIANTNNKWEITGLDNDGNLWNDGNYIIKFEINDLYGNTAIIEKQLIIDSTPAFINLDHLSNACSPMNHDNFMDVVDIELSTDEKATLNLWIGNSDDHKRVHLTEGIIISNNHLQIEWDGKDNFSNYVGDGDYFITYSSVDMAGNISEGTFNAPVRIDNTPPEIKLINITENQYFIIPSDISISYKTNENTQIKLKITDQNDSVLFIYENNFTQGIHNIPWQINENILPGLYKIQIRSTDDYNNVSEIIKNVELIKDNFPPEIFLEEELTYEAQDILTQIILPSPIVRDDSLPITITNNAPLNGFSLGETIITWTATDKYGNASTKNQKIILQDTTPPEFTTIPETLIIEATDILTPINNIGTAEAYDLFTVTITNNAPEKFPLGENKVLWQAEDANGNYTTIMQLVIVIDTTCPELIVPNDIRIKTDQLLTKIEIGQANATDIFPVTITHNAPELFQLGTTIVTWTAIDQNGNMTMKTQKIMIYQCNLATSKDSFIKKNQKNVNEGANPNLIIQGDEQNRILVGFDLKVINLQGLKRAYIVLTFNSKMKHPIQYGYKFGVYKLLTDWQEGNGWFEGRWKWRKPIIGTGSGVTWNSPADENIANHNPDGELFWNGGDFSENETDSVILTKKKIDSIEWDVTEDIKNGATYGWLFKRIDHWHHNTEFYFYSKEGAQRENNQTLAPTLVLEYEE